MPWLLADLFPLQLLEWAAWVLRLITPGKQEWTKLVLHPRELRHESVLFDRKPIPGGQPHDALLLKRDDTILDPDTIAAHTVGKHHVGEESVTDNGDLAGVGDTSLRMIPKILHDLGTTARFFGLMGEHLHSCGLLKL